MSFWSQPLGSAVGAWKHPETIHNERVWLYVALNLNGADAGGGRVDRVLKDLEFQVTERVIWTGEQSLAEC